MFSEETILKMFKDTQALLEGHFQLSSGLHSNKYIQCARVLQYPEYASILCHQLSKKFRSLEIDAVAGPALGAVVVTHEMARALQTRAIFTERQNGAMALRRGFEIGKGEKVVVVEDVITTGGSLSEVIDLVKKFGGEVVGIGSIVNRSEGKIKWEVPAQSLIEMKIETYQPENCPMCAQKVPVEKPGSRTN